MTKKEDLKKSIDLGESILGDCVNDLIIEIDKNEFNLKAVKNIFFDMVYCAVQTIKYRMDLDEGTNETD